jgi:hypothetical protein
VGERAAHPPIDEVSRPWGRRLLSELRASDERAIALAGAMTPAQLNWKPRPDIWSVGQCLEHLCVASEVYLPAISAALDNSPTGIAQEITPGWFGRWFIRNYIEPSAETKRAKAPRKIAPGAQIDAAILDRFLENNEKLREVIDRARACDVNRIRFRNPFVPLLRFTVGTGFEILSKHEQRHLLQAERVRGTSGFPAAGE